MVAGFTSFDLWVLALAAVAADRLLGEPRRWHPLVGFGTVAAQAERLARRLAGADPWALRLAGVLAVALLVGGGAAAAFMLLAGLPAPGQAVGHAALLAFALGGRALHDHLRPIALALQGGDLALARRLTGRIVSRDTAQADAPALARAAVESALENGSDAVIGALCWFAVAGGPGALAYRLANTLDAMWGYREAPYRDYGWAPARLDDVLSWPAARLTALGYALLGRTRRAWQCWRRQAPAWDSPNAGPVMAAGAGALGLRLGGMAHYGGRPTQRLPLGRGRRPRAGDIGRALTLVDRTLLLGLVTWGAGAALWRWAA